MERLRSVVELQLSGSILRDEVVLRWAVRAYLGLLLGGRGVDQRLVRGGTRVSRRRQAGCGGGSKLLCGRNTVAVGHGREAIRVDDQRLVLGETRVLMRRRACCGGES